MLRTSRCFRIKLFQFVGPRALPAIALFPYSLFSSFKRNLALWGHAAPLASDHLKSLPKRSVSQDQSIFGKNQLPGGVPITSRGSGRRFTETPPISDGTECSGYRNAVPANHPPY